MNTFCFFDKDSGVVKRWTQCPESELIYNLGENEDYLTVDGPRHGLWKVVDGQLQEVVPEPTPLAVADQRRAAYPGVGDQLDAIWKTLAKVDQSLLPQEAVTIMQQIAAVKEQYPKPTV